MEGLPTQTQEKVEEIKKIEHETVPGAEKTAKEANGVHPEDSTLAKIKKEAGLMMKLRSKLTGKSIEQLMKEGAEKEIKEMKAQLEEDIRSLTHFKISDSGLGGGLGNVSLGGIWKELPKTYGVPQEMINEIAEGMKKLKTIPEGDEKIAFQKSLNYKKLDITELMRNNANEKIKQMQ